MVTHYCFRRLHQGKFRLLFEPWLPSCLAGASLSQIVPWYSSSSPFHCLLHWNFLPSTPSDYPSNFRPSVYFSTMHHSRLKIRWILQWIEREIPRPKFLLCSPKPNTCESRTPRRLSSWAVFFFGSEREQNIVTFLDPMCCTIEIEASSDGARLELTCSTARDGSHLLFPFSGVLVLHWNAIKKQHTRGR